MSDRPRTTFDGAALRAARRRLGLSLPALSAKTGVSISAIKYAEAGTHQPRALYARALAHGVGLDVDDLMVERPAEDDQPLDAA